MRNKLFFSCFFDGGWEVVNVDENLLSPLRLILASSSTFFFFSPHRHSFIYAFNRGMWKNVFLYGLRLFGWLNLYMAWREEWHGDHLKSYHFISHQYGSLHEIENNKKKNENKNSRQQAKKKPVVQATGSYLISKTQTEMKKHAQSRCKLFSSLLYSFHIYIIWDI